jgi:hypothetical protein
MADIESAAEAAGMTIADFKALKPAQRMVFAARADHGHAMPDHAKIDRIRDESELATLETRLAKLDAEPPAKFANGRGVQAHTREFITDRIAGIRRRMTAS